MEIPAGGSGNTVCQEEAGQDTGTVPLKYTHGAIVTGGSTELTARPLSENPLRVLLRWSLDADKGGTLYASGCTAPTWHRSPWASLSRHRPG